MPYKDPADVAAYNRRPDVKERNRLRRRARYVPHPRPRLVRVDARPATCAHCGGPNEQPRSGWRKFCTARCRMQAWGKANGWGYRPVAQVEPLPMPYVGHPVFEQAAAVARLTSTAYSVDWGQNDIMGEAVLAILEGRDPEQAVRAHRAAEKGIDKRRKYGVADIGIDADGNIFIAKDFDNE